MVCLVWCFLNFMVFSGGDLASLRLCSAVCDQLLFWYFFLNFCHLFLLCSCNYLLYLWFLLSSSPLFLLASGEYSWINWFLTSSFDFATTLSTLSDSTKKCSLTFFMRHKEVNPIWYKSLLSPVVCWCKRLKAGWFFMHIHIDIHMWLVAGKGTDRC